MLYKLLFDQNPKDVYVFNNYQISSDVRFDILTFNHKQRFLTAYILLDNKFQLDVIVKQLDQTNRMNNFVDKIYIVMNDMREVREVEPVISYLTKDADLKNIGLIYLNGNEEKASVILEAEANDNYWYMNYVKPAEIRKLNKVRDDENTSDLLHRATDYYYDDLSYQHEWQQAQNPDHHHNFEMYSPTYNESVSSEFKDLDQWYEESKVSSLNLRNNKTNGSAKQTAKQMLKDFNNSRSNLLNSSEYYRKLEGITKCLNNLDDLSNKLAEKFNEE